ncbi:hypothetical protein T5B8_11387 [Salinisphaera sp. T5B8]|uniref:DUF4340 domain-containing protein n=1 Tax=Salinisphaera sp. T5B8 TaxID=1304154 RepID=UPI003341C6EE
MNRKRLIFNSALILGIAVLGLTLWLLRKPTPAPPETVSALPAAAITAIEVHLPDAIVQLERRGAGHSWQMREPIAAPADTAPLEAMLALADATPTQRYERGAIDDKTTGLDEPALVVRFNGQAPIAVGNEGPTPASRYVATPHALLLVEAERLARLPANWRNWVSPTLLADDADLSELILPRLTLTRSDTGGWQVAPAKADLGADYAQATIDAWRHSRALSLEPVDASRARIARVTLRYGDDRIRHLDVIEREPELILRDAGRGIDYHFAAHLAAPLLDMQHPDTLGAGRARSLQPSAIPLTPADDGAAGTTSMPD